MNDDEPSYLSARDYPATVGVLSELLGHRSDLRCDGLLVLDDSHIEIAWERVAAKTSSTEAMTIRAIRSLHRVERSGHLSPGLARPLSDYVATLAGQRVAGPERPATCC